MPASKKQSSVFDHEIIGQIKKKRQQSTKLLFEQLQKEYQEQFLPGSTTGKALVDQKDAIFSNASKFSLGQYRVNVAYQRKRL